MESCWFPNIVGGLLDPNPQHQFYVKAGTWFSSSGEPLFLRLLLPRDPLDLPKSKTFYNYGRRKYLLFYVKGEVGGKGGGYIWVVYIPDMFFKPSPIQIYMYIWPDMCFSCKTSLLYVYFSKKYICWRTQSSQKIYIQKNIHLSLH